MAHAEEKAPSLVVLVFDPSSGRVSVNGGEWLRFRLGSQTKFVRPPKKGTLPPPPGEGDDMIVCADAEEPPFGCHYHAWNGSRWVNLGGPICSGGYCPT
jgi:hypothetical protein